MTHLQKLRFYPVLRWVSSNLSLNSLRSPEYPIFRHTFPCYNVQKYDKFFGSVAVSVEVSENYGENARRVPPTVRREAQGALLDYLHSTRSLLFMDAEYMSKNSPHFLKKLVENVRHEADVRRSMARFLSYHPINEFEPFLESIGLEPSEVVSLLPRSVMFLSDESGLLDNYHVLCEYGIERHKIGKIYKEAREVFRYDHGVLHSKLQAFEEVGVSKHVVAMAVSFNPNLLISGMSIEFFELLRKFKSLGYEYSWVEQRLVEDTSYNWRQMTHLLHLLHGLGCNEEEIRKLIGRRSGLLFDHSGRPTLLLIGFLLKFGSSKDDICSIFLRFPQVKAEKFVWNLRRTSDLLSEIEMDAVSIGRIIREHFRWLGTCSLKRANSILANLNTGKKHLCQIIMADPMELKNWTLRAKVERLADTREVRSRRDKLKFLSSIGFIENSDEIEQALKVFRGKGNELQERFDCLVKAGLSENDVVRMIKAAPHILNQSIEVLEAKISMLVNDLGYPVSTVKSFPGFMSYTMDRVKLRCAMYKWLIDQKVVRSTLSLSTIIGCTESHFVNKYVNRHPNGLCVWHDYKQNFSSI